MTELERKVRAKIPGPETGIEIKHSICDICNPGTHCGLDVYVKDGRIIKVEGTKGFPGSNGKLCTKGAANRQYVYQKNRLKTPMRRVGPRGSGRFEPISWETAYGEIADRLNTIKAKEGPEAVAWFTGYSKWYRPWLHRITHSFGSQNYGTESSSCYQATALAWKTIAGREFGMDLANAKVFVGWGCNQMVNFYMSGRRLLELKKRGGKIIIIDPRSTPTSQKLADIHLQLHPGTDGALALGMARLMIERGWVNQDYIDRYVHGYDEFKAYVSRFTLEETARITGVPAEKILVATEMYAKNAPASAYTPSAAVTHHINGYNNMRAIIALQALTGSIDQAGGGSPIYPRFVYVDGGFDTMEPVFTYETRPENCKPPIGKDRFPVWHEYIHEFQAMDMMRQINEGTPYPIKALMAFGMNARMFPQSGTMLDTLKGDRLELVVAVDLVETSVTRCADYVLPACSSLERSELKVYGGGFLTCTTPAIEPLYESKCDGEIICDLARHLGLEDQLLTSGYDNTLRYMLSNLDITLEELREAPLPIKVPSARSSRPGTLLEKGFETKSGKLELWSETIDEIARKYPDRGYEPLPAYHDSFDNADPAAYPLVLVAGARLPNAIHSRLHRVPWPRSLRREASVDMHPDDAAARGLKEGDRVELYSQFGAIRVGVHLTRSGLPGDVYMFQGYEEANVNDLLGAEHLDPYSGFPGFRQVRCNIRKVVD